MHAFAVAGRLSARSDPVGLVPELTTLTLFAPAEPASLFANDTLQLQVAVDDRIMSEAHGVFSANQWVRYSFGSVQRPSFVCMPLRLPYPAMVTQILTSPGAAIHAGQPVLRVAVLPAHKRRVVCQLRMPPMERPVQIVHRWKLPTHDGTIAAIRTFDSPTCFNLVSQLAKANSIYGIRVHSALSADQVLHPGDLVALVGADAHLLTDRERQLFLPSHDVSVHSV